jgi:hypothetical protein
MENLNPSLVGAHSTIETPCEIHYCAECDKPFIWDGYSNLCLDCWLPAWSAHQEVLDYEY